MQPRGNSQWAWCDEVGLKALLSLQDEGGSGINVRLAKGRWKGVKLQVISLS